MEILTSILLFVVGVYVLQFILTTSSKGKSKESKYIKSMSTSNPIK